MSAVYHSAFNDDTDAQETVRHLLAERNIKTIVETGTYHGITTAHLAQFCRIHTIETRSDFLEVAHANWPDRHNIISHLGDSRTILPTILPTLPRPIFFFLDAHWGYEHPLLTELKIIGNHHLDDSTIMIHDCLVPGTDLGYDPAGDEHIISLKYIASHLPAIYPQGYQYKYNSPERAGGARRGIIYIHGA